MCGESRMHGAGLAVGESDLSADHTYLTIGFCETVRCYAERGKQDVNLKRIRTLFLACRETDGTEAASCLCTGWRPASPHSNQR